MTEEESEVASSMATSPMQKTETEETGKEVEISTAEEEDDEEEREGEREEEIIVGGGEGDELTRLIGAAVSAGLMEAFLAALAHDDPKAPKAG